MNSDRRRYAKLLREAEKHAIEKVATDCAAC
jgi:ribonucleotide reductase beta subunit family protein with ferritin-like domain